MQMLLIQIKDMSNICEWNILIERTPHFVINNLTWLI